MSQNVNVNLTPGGYPKEFHVSQYDVGRQLVAKVVDSTGDYSIPSGATAVLVGTKPSGFGFTLNGTVSGSTVTFTTVATVTAEYGRIPCEIRITNGSTILGTANCMLVVEMSPHPEGTTDGDGEQIISEITLLLQRITEQADRADSASQTAQTAATSATGSASAAASSESNAAASAATAVGAKNDAEAAKTAAEASEASAAESAAEARETLETYAKVDGEYDAMTVGTAKALLGDTISESTEPYTFRQTGGGLEVGTREVVEQVVGGTVAWNQLVQNGDFGDTSGWTAAYGDISAADNVLTYTATRLGTDTYFNYVKQPAKPNIPAHHKVLVCFDIYPAHSKSIYAYLLNYAGNPTVRFDAVGGKWNTYAKIIENGTASTKEFQIALNIQESTGYSVGEQDKIKNFCIFDLTAMFGSTIADYIYSLEQATEGAGVAWFRNYFPNDYYPYDPGTLRSVEGVSAHETVGFNQWDEEWELGALSATGDNATSSTEIRSKNYIPVVGGQTYYLYCAVSSTFNYKFYDADKNFISGSYIGRNNTLTIPNGARYMRFYMGAAYGTTYKNEICINLSDPTRNGEYEPYTKHTYPLDSSLTLRGIPKLDSFNNLYYDGDEYESDGTVTRKYGIVDLGTLEWSKNSGENVYYATLNNGKNADNINAITDASYTYIPRAQTSSDKIFKIISTSIVPTMYFRNDSTSTIADFVNTINGKSIVYELATPTTETADPYTSIQICDPDGTEEWVDERTVPIPVGSLTKYTADLVGKLEDLPTIPSAPSANGTYTLKATVSGGTVTYSWVNG